MPPQRNAARGQANAPMAQAAPPLSGLKIVLCGTFPGYSHAKLKQHLDELGAETLAKVTPDSTHLIVTPENFGKPSVKTVAALEQKITIVKVQWLLDCVKDNAKKPEATYLFSTSAPASPAAPSPTAAPSPSPVPAAAATKKRAPKRSASSSDAAATNALASQPLQKRPKPADKKSKTSKSLSIPVDEPCPLAGSAEVHVDDEGVIWDAALNKTDSGSNNNKFYRIQLLNNGGNYKTWTRWGRVGELGQSSMLGTGSLADAIKMFKKKFKDKSGLKWEERDKPVKQGNYAYVEKSYEADSDDEADAASPGDDKAAGSDEENNQLPVCSLTEAVQSVVELIFNRRYFSATMSSFNYDANKLPLGKLSKMTISRGFQALKDLAALLDDPIQAQSSRYDIEHLSNTYYSLIPHAFGRMRPPIINENALLEREVELLESLSDMKDAALLMKVKSKSQGLDVHPTDTLYQGLGMKEMTVLDRKSVEFQELAKYLTQTRGETHNVNYKIDDIFRIERQGEQDRFNASIVKGMTKNKRLLWHGSRATNYGGILNQGLRIAPPEAPVTGYMFGKGIYLADMSSKSANYCYSYISDGTALLLLCEADLGDPVQELTHASCGAAETAKAQNLYSTLGMGKTAPKAWKDAGCVHPDLAGVQMPDVSTLPGPVDIKDGYLLYNEYIVYDVSQVRLRYLFRVRM